MKERQWVCEFSLLLAWLLWDRDESPGPWGNHALQEVEPGSLAPPWPFLPSLHRLSCRNPETTRRGDWWEGVYPVPGLPERGPIIVLPMKELKRSQLPFTEHPPAPSGLRAIWLCDLTLNSLPYCAVADPMTLREAKP